MEAGEAAPDPQGPFLQKCPGWGAEGLGGEDEWEVETEVGDGSILLALVLRGDGSGNGAQAT